MANILVIAHRPNYNRTYATASSLPNERMPNGEQQRDMRRFAGSCRFVFNKALAIQKENHEAGKVFISYVAMAKHLTTWRNGVDTPWLKDAPCHPLQQALKDVEKAYKNF